jgi:hypothetical protein
LFPLGRRELNRRRSPPSWGFGGGGGGEVGGGELEFGEGGLEVLDNFGGVFKGYVFEPEEVEASLVAGEAV